MNFNFDELKRSYKNFMLKSFNNEYIVYDKHSKISYSDYSILIKTKMANAWVKSLVNDINDEKQVNMAFSPTAECVYNALMTIYTNDLIEYQNVREEFCLRETLIDLDLNQSLIISITNAIANDDFIRESFETWARYATRDPRLYPKNQIKTTLR